MHNAGPWRKHEAACTDQTDWTAPATQITYEMATKLKMAFSFAAYPHMDSIRGLDSFELSQNRPYVGHFAGTVEYGPDVEWLNQHRKNAVAALAATPGPNINFSDRAMQFSAYFQSLRESEFVWSPWGLGEPCYRDFEAIMSGCCVVKPDTSYVVTVPYEFYRIPQISRHIVKPNYSDAADVLARAQRVPIGDRIMWAAHVARENSTEKIAGRLARIFKTAILEKS
jgi:hypothetical protein